MKQAWLLWGWDDNLAYARRLVADVPDDRMVFQPRPRMNHPAWILVHLCHYHPAILGLARGDPFQDPKDHPDASHYDEGSTPVADLALYPSKTALLDRFTIGHREIAEALSRCGEHTLGSPPALPRWQATFPTAAAALVYLMLVHESTHLGQLSAWRRVQALPRV